MSKIFSLLSPLILSLALISCAVPQSRYPTPTALQIQQEQAVHEKIVREKGKVKPIGNIKVQQRHIDRLRTVAPKIGNAGLAICQDMNKPENKCKFDFVVMKDGPVNAYADGQKVYITPAMMDTMDANNEMAFVLAHEYAHNLMRHVQSTQQNVGIASVAGLLLDAKLGTNAFSKMAGNAAQMRYSKSFEREADYVGMYILARAGYNIDKVAEVWREASLRNPNSIYMATTHPTNPERFINLSYAIDEIKTKQKQGKKLVPDMHAEKKYF